jgi:hypothetical protein
MVKVNKFRAYSNPMSNGTNNEYIDNEEHFDPSELEQVSYHLGVVFAFAEIVGSGVKRMALSSPLTRDLYNEIIDRVHILAKEYGIVLYIDDDFLETKLFNPDYTCGKRVIHIARDKETIKAYKTLRDRKRKHLAEGTLTEEVETEVAWEMGRLLSYSDEAIRGLLVKQRF